MKTINLTPTWEGIMPGLIEVLQNGTEEGKELAKAELMDLARKVDEINK
ncbi:MAG: hypothetical protein GTN53_18290 [Candidatus Aminicenantes bacterium]|nr:hypothetical protein [Candidatus Aminicenantes bacterium]NIT24447.1 hypothetical protein [Candidatus Aminicenantes bacterium]